MKKTIRIFGSIALAAVIGFSFAACDTNVDDKGSLTIVNGGDTLYGGGSTITRVYISRIVESDSESGMDWGNDLLSGSIPRGSERTFELPGAGNYNIRVIADSLSYYRWDFKVSGNTTIYFVQDTQRGTGGFNAGTGASGFNTKLTVKAQGVSSDGFQLYWNEIPGAYGYLIFASTYAGFYNDDENYEEYYWGYTVDTSLTAYNGSAGTTYYFHVWAFDKNAELLSSYNDGRASVTLTAAAPTLDGVWSTEGNWVIEYSNGTGTIRTIFNNPKPLAQSAIQKGYIKIGGTQWRNVRPNSDGTWTGDFMGLMYRGTNYDVCTGIGWYLGCTFRLTDNGQTLKIGGGTPSTGSNGPLGVDAYTFTRQ